MQRFSDLTLDEILVRRAAADGDRLVFAEQDARMSYHDLSHDAGALAAGLFDIGARRGDRIALVLPAGLVFVRLFWAVQRLGAISCAFNPFAPAEAVVGRAARIRPRLMIVARRDPLVFDGAAGAGIECIHIDEIPRGTPLEPSAGDANDVAYLQSTSGTSGEPRAAMVLHRNVTAVQRSSSEAMRIGPDDVLVSWVPPWHDLGLIRFIIGPVFTGASCHIVMPSVHTIPQWLATIGRVGGTITGAPDFAYRLATRLTDPRNIDLSTLRFATNGGEPVRHSTILAFEQKFRVRGVVLPGYGLAEATLGVSSVRPGESLRVDERGNVACGRPLPGVEVRVDQSGEILVRGDGVFAGYFDAEDATWEVLRDRWLHTGDIGRLDAEGHLYILGRRRAMLKRGGAILAPREVEEAAQEVPEVKIAAAIGLASPDVTTEQIVVVVETDSTRNDIAAAVSQSIERALGFTPERVVVVPPRSIPRTANGKIRHDALRREMERVISADPERGW